MIAVCTICLYLRNGFVFVECENGMEDDVEKRKELLIMSDESWDIQMILEQIGKVAS